MNNRELLQAIREDIRNATSQGQTPINPNDLDTYLVLLDNQLATDPASLDQFVLERIKAAREFAIATLKHSSDANLEMFKSVIASGQAALKASMVINGGAATALLAFIGHLIATSPTKGVAAPFALPMLLFVSGVLAGAIAFGFTYVAQRLYAGERKSAGHRQGKRRRCGPVLSALRASLTIRASSPTLTGGAIAWRPNGA